MVRSFLMLVVLACSTNALEAQIRQPVRGFPQPVQQQPRTEIQVPADTNPDPKSLEISEAELSKARSLTLQLGSRDFQERDQATQELGKMGRAALVALKEIRTTETNPEVRLRVDLLLPKAESDDMRARAFCFLADKEGKYNHKLPGWTKFKDIAGTDRASRELFAEVLIKSEYHSLLMAHELSAPELGKKLSHYYQTMPQMQYFGVYTQARPAELAVLAILECQYPEKDMPIPGRQKPRCVGEYLYHGEALNALRDGTGPYAQPLRRIFVKWMETRESGPSMQQALNVAVNSGMKDQLRYSARMLLVKEPNYHWAKAEAAKQIAAKDNSKDGKEEARKYLPYLLKGLDEDSVVTQIVFGGLNPRNAQIVVYTQDYILGILCRLTNQKPSDYGLDELVKGQDDFQSFASWHFQDDETKKAADKRAAGIKKFKEWAEKNIVAEPVKKDEPKPIAPPPLPMKK